MLKEKIKNLFVYVKVKALYKKYERQIIPAALVFGFAADIVTFRSIDIVWAFILLAAHIVVVATAIAFINIYDARRANMPGKLKSYLRIFSPLAMQFSFGALFSASFIFYSFGGVFSVSWPLIVLFFFLMASNEIFKQSYLKSSVQLSVFFFSSLFVSLRTISLTFFSQTLVPVWTASPIVVRRKR